MNKKSIIQSLTFLLTLLCFTFLSSITYAQCPTGDVFLKSQDDVDNFLINYPNCSSFGGSLIIAAGEPFIAGEYRFGVKKRFTGVVPVTDLTPLSGITSVSGNLIVYGHQYLVNLSGLENITSVGGNFRINYNYRNETINGTTNTLGLEKVILSGLTTVGGHLTMNNNSALKKANGLENLLTVGGDLSFNYNFGLDTLRLTNLSSVGGNFFLFSSREIASLGPTPWPLTTIGNGFYLYGLDSLKSLNAFSNLTTVGGEFLINSVKNLQSLSDFSSLSEIKGQMVLEDNPNLASLGGLNINFIGPHSGPKKLSIQIINNPSLVNLDGQFTVDTILTFLHLLNNASLVNLDALSGIDSTTDLRIYYNNLLTNVDDLESLTYASRVVQVSLNPNLTDLTGLCPLFSTGDIDGILSQSGNGAVLDSAHCVIDPYAILDQLSANNTINKGQKNALTKKLNKCHITPFKNQVNAFVNNGTLTQEEADDLIEGIEGLCSGARLSAFNEFSISQNYPNPTEGYTTIPFTLSQTSEISLRLYDATGRLMKVIVNETLMEGEHQIKVDLRDLPQGTYFYRMEVGGMVETLPMVKK